MRVSKPRLTVFGVLAIGVPLSLLAGLFWWAASVGRERWENLMDIESFNTTQRSVWNECRKLSGLIDKVQVKLDEFDGPSALQKYANARAALVPEQCQYLEALRSAVHKKKYLESKK